MNKAIKSIAHIYGEGEITSNTGEKYSKYYQSYPGLAGSFVKGAWDSIFD